MTISLITNFIPYFEDQFDANFSEALSIVTEAKVCLTDISESTTKKQLYKVNKRGMESKIVNFGSAIDSNH